MRRDGRLWLIALTAVAVLLRLGSAVLQGDDIVPLPGVFDQISYDALAQRVAAGYGFSFGANWWPATQANAPTAHWSFVYTLYLSAVYLIAGHHPVVARVIQAGVAGVLFPWLTWRIAGRLFGAQVGVTAAALSAVYGYFAFYAGSLMTETFYLGAILWAFDVATAMGPTRTAQPLRRWATLGFALGIASVLRQPVLAVVPFLLAWLGWTLGRRVGWRYAARGTSVLLLVMACLIVPWTIRNYTAFGRVVVLNTNAGYAFFWANHPIHGYNFIADLPNETYSRLIPTELRGLDEAALDAALLSRGIGFVKDDPGRYLVLSLSRAKDLFEFWPSADSGVLSNVVRLASFGLYLPFMLAGLVLSSTRGDLREHGWRSSLVPLYGFIALYCLLHLLSWGGIRYRLPVDAVLMPFAALALVTLSRYVHQLVQSRAVQAPAGGCGIAE